MGCRNGEGSGKLHAALESVEISGEDGAGLEIDFVEGAVVCVRAGRGDVFWVVGWWILA